MTIWELDAGLARCLFIAWLGKHFIFPGEPFSLLLVASFATFVPANITAKYLLDKMEKS